jgi:uncharacterized protein YggE
MKGIVQRISRREARSWVVVAALLGLIGGLLAGSAMAASPVATPVPSGGSPPEHTISVTGTGSVFVTPDTADLRLGIVISRATVVQARDAAAKAMTNVVASLRSSGIVERDIQTSTFSLQPVYDYSSGGKAPRIVGYELRSGVSVIVRDLDRVGPAIDGVLGAGATTVDQLTLRVADPTAAESRAREAAVKAARAKADTLARAAGTSISSIASITESVATPPWPVRDSVSAPSEGGGTVVVAGSSEVSVTVSIVYVIR